jgi:hypothetical protein
MSELKVKAETLPNRCEICHQSDKFDSVTGNCVRCINVNKIVNRSDEKIELTYTLTVKDRVEYNLYALPRTFSLQMILIIGALLNFFLTYSLSFASIFMKIIFAFLSVVIWIVFLVIFLIIFWIPILFISLKTKGNKVRNTEFNLTVNEKFLIEESKYKREQCNWNAIYKIGQSKNCIFIFDTDNSAIIIPKRAFTSKGQELRFMRLINKFWKANT